MMKPCPKKRTRRGRPKPRSRASGRSPKKRLHQMPVTRRGRPRPRSRASGCNQKKAPTTQKTKRPRLSRAARDTGPPPRSGEIRTRDSRGARRVPTRKWCQPKCGRTSGKGPSGRRPRTEDEWASSKEHRRGNSKASRPGSLRPGPAIFLPPAKDSWCLGSRRWLRLQVRGAPSRPAPGPSWPRGWHRPLRTRPAECPRGAPWTGHECRSCGPWPD